MKARLAVATAGLATLGAGAYVCAPTVERVTPIVQRAAHALTLPLDAPTLHQDTVLATRTWTRLRGDVVMAGAVPLYGGSAALLGLLVMIGAVAVRRSSTDEKVDVRETELLEGAHWATERELVTYRRPTTTLPIRLGQPCGVTAKGRVTTKGKDLRMPRRLARENMLIVAPPGAGKSSDLIAALLDMGTARADAPSIFAWDPKGEVARTCAARLRRVGYEVLELHPFLDRGRINPLHWCTSARWIETFLSAWLANTESGVGGTSDEVHEGWTRQIVGAAILALRGRHGDDATLPLVFRTLDGDPDAVYALLKEADDEGAGAATWHRLMTGPQGTFDRQRTSIKTRGAAFKEPSMRRFVEGHDLDLDRLLTRTGKPLAVFYQLPTATQEMVLPLTAGIVALLFAKVGDYAAGAEIERDLLCIFDEAGSGAVIPSLPQGLNTLRGAGVAQLIIVQYLDQLLRYGKAGKAGIEAGCGTWIGMGGMLPEDAQRFAERLGERSVRVEKTAVGTDAKTGKTRRRVAAPEIVARPLLTELQIRHLPRAVRLVCPRDTAPTLTYSRPYFEERRLSRRVVTESTADAPPSRKEAQRSAQAVPEVMERVEREGERMTDAPAVEGVDTRLDAGWMAPVTGDGWMVGAGTGETERRV